MQQDQLVQLLTPLPSRHKVPGFHHWLCRDWNLWVILFSAKANSAFYPSEDNK